MPFIGNKPSAVPLTSADIADGIITSAKIVDGTIVNADINASSAIALSKLSTTGTADATTFLRGDGAYTAVSSDYVLLATTTASGSATSVSFDGYFSSTYDNYILMCYNIYSSATGGDHTLRGYLRRSNANVTASSYLMYRTAGRAYSGANDTGNQGGNYGEAQIRFNENSQTESSAGANSYNITLHLFDPLGTTNYKYGLFNYVTHSATNAQFHSSLGGFALKDNTNALSGITIYVNSGNIYGKFKLYGIK